jgi:hypothetical protein
MKKQQKTKGGSHKEGLRLAISALNQIPNTKNSEYGTTYKLIPILEEMYGRMSEDVVFPYSAGNWTGD